MTDRKFPDNFHTAEFSQEARDDMTDAVRLVGWRFSKCKRFGQSEKSMFKGGCVCEWVERGIGWGQLILLTDEADWLANNLCFAKFDECKCCQSFAAHAKMLRGLK